jgi:hypothetical protein
MDNQTNHTDHASRAGLLEGTTTSVVAEGQRQARARELSWEVGEEDRPRLLVR